MTKPTTTISTGTPTTTTTKARKRGANKTAPPTPTTAPTTRTSAALSLLTSTYLTRSIDALAALRERESEISASIHGFVGGLADNQYLASEETAMFRALLGPDLIDSYVRAEAASRALASIAEAELTGASTPPVTRSVPTIPQAASSSAKATSVKAAAATVLPTAEQATPGILDLRSAPQSWNYYSARKAAESAATSAGWTAQKLAKFLEALAAVKKHAAVVEIAAKAGLQVLRTAPPVPDAG